MAKEFSSFQYTRYWFDFCFEHQGEVNTNDTALYLWLVELKNRMGWVENFGCPASQCMAAMAVGSYNTYKKSFDKLVQLGFVKVIKPSINQYQANIIALSDIDKPLIKALDKALVKHVTKHSESTIESTCDIDKQVNQETNKPLNQVGTNVPTQKEIFENSGKTKKELFEFAKQRFVVYDLYFELWNLIANEYGLRKVKALTPSRKASIKARLKEPEFDIIEILKNAAHSDFIRSESFFTFDWVFGSKNNYVKVIEGNYNNKPKPEPIVKKQMIVV